MRAQFKKEKGAPAKPFRMALGALIIKEQLGISDRETVEQIKENPYLQYFIGLETYTFEAPFEASMMVHFRQRINVEMVNKINEEMVKRGREKTEQKEEKSSSDSEEIGERENKGKLILDATCAPGNIKYPTDLEILNQGRKATEQIIDSLYKSIKGRLLKLPRTYRNIARKEYLRIAKKRHSTKKEGSWENFNESGDLQEQIEKFKQTYGYYPESVHADRIYRSKANKDWCRQRGCDPAPSYGARERAPRRGIRLSGIGLERPPKNISQEEKKQTRIDEAFRNRIEGKFGQAKRRFSLDLIKTKLKETSETAIAIAFLVVNLSQLLRQFLLPLLSFSFASKTFELNKQNVIIKTYFSILL